MQPKTIYNCTINYRFYVEEKMENNKNFEQYVSETIKHYEMLQKRYIKQHGGKSCVYVEVALMALYAYETSV